MSDYDDNYIFNVQLQSFFEILFIYLFIYHNHSFIHSYMASSIFIYYK